jgi:hypothetical protein
MKDKDLVAYRGKSRKNLKNKDKMNCSSNQRLRLLQSKIACNQEEASKLKITQE